MIQTFASKDTEALFNRNTPPKIPSTILRVALRKLVIIHAAVDLGDLKVPPGNRLEKLTGDRSGQHSIRINDQWRVCFLWKAGNAYEVEIVDYH